VTPLESRRNPRHHGVVASLLRPRIGFVAAVVATALLAFACGDGDAANGGSSSSGATLSSGGSSSGASSGGSSTGSSSGTSSGTLPSPVTGQATYYDATGEGACSFPASPQDLNVAAVSASHYGDAVYCGACLEVKGPNGTVVVRAVDLCPGCEKGALDLSPQAFKKIADLKTGVVPITWSVVRCNVQGPVQYYTKDGSSKYWTAIQVRNHAVPIKKLEIQKGGVFVDAPRENYNFFVLPTGSGTDAAFKVRLTADNGAVLEDTLPGPKAMVLTPGHANFP
jgi:expansin (peptidoglycan-binding protein)